MGWGTGLVSGTPDPHGLETFLTATERVAAGPRAVPACAHSFSRLCALPLGPPDLPFPCAHSARELKPIAPPKPSPSRLPTHRSQVRRIALGRRETAPAGAHPRQRIPVVCLHRS